MHIGKTLASITAGFGIFAAASTVQAQPPNYYAPNSGYYSYWGQFYIGADVGGSIMQDMNVRNANAKMAFDPGTRTDFIFGFQVAPPVSLELETGVIWNSLRTGNGLFISTIADRGDMYQVPVLANVVYRIPLCPHAWAYIGGGAGGVATELDYHHTVEFRHANDTDFTFAYQGMCGIKYAVAPNMEVGLGYKFLGTLSHTWFNNDPILLTQTDPAYSHSFLASFTWRF